MRVVGVAEVVGEHLVPHPGVGGGVHVVGGGVESGQAAGDVAGPQALGCEGQVAEGDEAAVALPERLPRFVAAELTTDQFGVGDDRAGPVQREVIGQLSGRAEPGRGAGGDGGGAAGAALVEQQDPVGLQGAVQPAAGVQRAG